MGIVGLIFGQQRVVIDPAEDGLKGAIGKLTGVLRQTFGGFGGIVIDATLSEDHKSSCEVTRNPIEDGSDVTDHVQMKPVELTLNGVISDSPLGYAIIGNIQNLVRSVETLFTKNSLSIEIYNKLLNLQNSRRPFTVITGLKRYTNMIMEDLTVPRDVATGASLHFTASLKEVKIIRSNLVSIANFSDSAAGIAGPRKDTGQRVTAPQTQKRTSILDDVRNWMGGGRAVQ